MPIHTTIISKQMLKKVYFYIREEQRKEEIEKKPIKTLSEQTYIC